MTEPRPERDRAEIRRKQALRAEKRLEERKARCTYQLKPESLAFLERVRVVPWFENVGKPLEPAVRRATDLAHAKRMAICDQYVNVGIAASNKLSEYVFRHARERFQNQWNEIVWMTQRVVEPLLSEAVEKGVRVLGITDAEREDFGIGITSPVYGAVHEIEYADLLHQNFKQGVFAWYERGHWPCGFVGEWPDVEVVVW